MMSYLRYAMATVFLAASVGYLALWWRSYVIRDANGNISPISIGSGLTRAHAWRGDLYVAFGTPAGVALVDYPVAMERYGWRERTPERRDRFVLSQDAMVCPLWYPALIFTLAGVAVLRFRRQFSIRSALVGLTAVALLLGMVVAL